MQQEQKGMRDTTQENITALFHGTSSQTASSSKESLPSWAQKKLLAKAEASKKKPKTKADASVKKQRAKAPGPAKERRAKAKGSAKKQRAKPDDSGLSAQKQITASCKAPGRPPSGPKKPPKVLQQGSALSKAQQEAQDQNEKKGEHGPLSSSAAHARAQWEAKGSKRKLARNPSACSEEIHASTMPPEITLDSSHPRAARNIAEVFETLNENAKFLKDAYPQMGERVSRNLKEVDYYSDFTGPDMAVLGHMGPNNFTG